jgi:hypothetical protein
MREIVRDSVGATRHRGHGGSTRRQTIIDLVGQLHPDWVVIALDESDNKPSICDLLFGRFPDLKILALDSGKNNCIFYRASISIRSSRVESSERGILDALRGRRPVSSGLVEVPGNTKVN